MSLNFPPIIGFETRKHNAGATFYPTVAQLMLNVSQSRIIEAIPSEQTQGLVEGVAQNVMPSPETLAEYGAIASYCSKFFTIAGYIPFLGSVVGVIRIIAGVVFLFVATLFANNINADYLPALKGFAWRMIGRGAMEFFNLGLVLLIPDLLATLYREVRPASFEHTQDQLWTPQRALNAN